MIPMKRVAGAVGVVAGFALIAFTGPAAIADESAPTLVSVDRPSNPGSQGDDHGKADKNDARDRDQAKDQSKDQDGDQDGDQERDQVRDQTKDQTRAELRAEIRANGGSWGAYQRQDSLIKVASKLAERYGATPENTNAHSLGRILTLINAGLPAGLQIDIEVFLAQYELSLSDITWPEGMEPTPTPEPSPSPSVSPSVSPSASPSVTPSVSPTA